MKTFSRYLIRHLFIGFAAVTAVLIPLFTTFDLISELDDVTPGGYRWTQALLVVLMTLPRTLIDLSPFIALLGGIVGLGQLAKNQELIAIRTAGFSIINIAQVALLSGLLLVVALSVLDEWVASPLQQRALQLKAQAESDNSANVLWARKNDEFVTIKTLGKHNQPLGIEIFHYKPDLSLDYYIYAQSAIVLNKQTWVLQGVNKKVWQNGNETVETQASMHWHSVFTGMSLQALTLPAGSFSIWQIRLYISYLQKTGQPSLEYQIALWQKAGQKILMLAMILLAIPFTFSVPRAPGLGSRLAIGVIVGLLTYISDQIIINLGLLFALNAPLITLAPPLLILVTALLLVCKFDRQH